MRKHAGLQHPLRYQRAAPHALHEPLEEGEKLFIAFMLLGVVRAHHLQQPVPAHFQVASKLLNLLQRY